MGIRIAAVAGTAALAGVGVAIALMVMPDRKDSGAAAAPTPTAPPKAARQAHPPAPRDGPTRAQLAHRRAAVAELRRQGFSPLNLAEYDPKASLRVLIGRRGDGARWAFFFVGTRYIGHDAITPSARLSVARTSKHAATLVYRTYGPADAACCPHGPRVKVRFRWDGSSLVQEQPMPPAYLRLQSG